MATAERSTGPSERAALCPCSDLHGKRALLAPAATVSELPPWRPVLASLLSSLPAPPCILFFSGKPAGSLGWWGLL